jgi:hypothetical protein
MGVARFVPAGKIAQPQATAIARETLARMSEECGWGADEEGIRAGKRDNDHRIRIAAQAVMDASSAVPDNT